MGLGLRPRITLGIGVVVTLLVAIGVAGWGTGFVVEIGVGLGLLATLIAGWVLHRAAQRLEDARRTASDSEARIRATLNAVHDAIIVIDERGRIFGANPAAEIMFGWTEAELQTQDVSALMPDPYAAEHPGYIATYLRTREPRILGKVREVEGQRRDGTVFPLELTVDEVRLGGGALMFTGVLRDLTERHLLETEREHSVMRYQSAVGVLAEGMVVQDASGRVVDCNPAAELILGLPRERVLQLAEQDFTWSGIHEDNSVFTREDHPALQTLRTGLPVRNVVFGLPRRTGLRWLLMNSAPMRDKRGRVVGVVSSFSDITRRKDAERRQRESEERLRDFLDSAGDLIVSTDPDGRIVFANRAWRETLGYLADDQVIGRPLLDFLAPDCLEACQVSFARVLSGERVRDIETTFVSKDGYRIQVSGTSNARMEGGRPVAARSIFRDVTELRAALEMLKEARNAAEQGNRAKSEFLANMSHELRTPLNSVIGFANVLLKNKAGNLIAQDLQFLQRIQENGRHLLALINTILDLSKIEAGRMDLHLADVALEQFVPETLALLQGQVEGRPVQLRTEVPPGLGTLRTDPGKLKQVLINLLGNALKFTERGSVTVRVVGGPGGAPDRIEVQDTGIGIPKARQQAVFVAFQQADNTTSRRFGGTGLGLTITRSLLDLLGYSVSLESDVGVGSTFRVHFRGVEPRVAEPRPADEAAEPAPADLAGRPVVLVIDDDPDARLLLTQYVRDAGCAVVTANGGPSGLKLAREHRPVLITLDVMMPQMNGLEVLEALQADPVTASIPVAIVSIVGTDQRDTAKGAVALIDKPVSREDIEAVLREYARPDLAADLQKSLRPVVRRYKGGGGGGPPACLPRRWAATGHEPVAMPAGRSRPRNRS